MAGTNQFLPFAATSGANALTPAQYALLTTLLAQGFQPNTNAQSQQVNTVLRQVSTVAAAIGTFIASQINPAGGYFNASDNNSPTTLATALQGAITAVITTMLAPYLTSTNAVATYQPKLGFSPVQQGGFSGDTGGAGGHKISVGWNGSNVLLDIDGTIFATYLPMNISGIAGNSLQLGGIAAAQFETSAQIAAAYQPLLNFTPVQQQGVAGYSATEVHTVNIGYYAVDGLVHISVDGNNFAGLWPINIRGNAATASNAGFATLANNSAQLGGIVAANYAQLSQIINPSGTWRNVTSGRAFNVVYTNPYGRAYLTNINCGVAPLSGVGVTFKAYVNGAQADIGSGVGNTSACNFNVFVPQGGTLEVVSSSGYGVVSGWSEFA